jgi:hypothetical protein
MKKYLLFIRFSIVGLFLSSTASAQFGDPPADPCTDPTLGCPIDTNVYLFIAVAVILALKKAYDYKKSVAL